MSTPRLALALIVLLVHTAAAAAQPADVLRFFTYVRLGQSAVMADGVRRAPAVGVGFRGELERFAIDVSFLNLAFDYDGNDPSQEIAVGSVLRVQGLKFLTPDNEGSFYVGGGLGLGRVSVGRPLREGGSDMSWHGAGLQGELTAGYELPRSSSLRLLIQADASVPFFAARSDTYAHPTAGSVVKTGSERRFIPSLVVSVGVGWQRIR